jgi:transcription initiation factor IIE alpha subunit
MIVVDKTLPVDIFFKPFKGNRVGAMNTAFTYVKDENYKHYLMVNDPAVLQQMMEKQSKHSHHKLVQKRRKEKKITMQQCPNCLLRVAVLHCFACQDLFCNECFQRTHARPPWTGTYHVI